MQAKNNIRKNVNEKYNFFKINKVNEINNFYIAKNVLQKVVRWIVCFYILVVLSACGNMQDKGILINETDENAINPWNETTSNNDISSGTHVGNFAEDNISVDSIVYEEILFDDEMELCYANQFNILSAAGGYKKIHISGVGEYLLIPEGKVVPKNVPSDITILQQPLNHTYLTATSAMDLICEVEALDNIILSGTKADGWYIEEAVQAMEDGRLIFSGKYSMPDYELLLASNCNLAIESTMILHSPEVKEQLENLGIPVIIERSSYESHPLGRLEWIKFYGVLFNKEQEADRIFNEQMAKISSIVEISEGIDGSNVSGIDDTLDVTNDDNLSVAFFYITTNGAVNVRKGSDYISQMIAMAGGNYVFADLEEDGNALSTMNMQMEAFYAGAIDADILIYNSAIDDELYTIDELLQKSELLADFSAVQSGNVFCTGKNLFQESMGIADLLVDFNKIIENPDVSDEELVYLYRLK